ncbi:MAG: response regulator [Pseudomonadota bacterium]
MTITTSHHFTDRGKNRRWTRANQQEAIEGLFAEYGPPRVLLAEDDDDFRRLIARVLRADGFEVTEVSSGSDLLDQLGSMLLFGEGKREFDIIVSDVRMPGKNGLDILAGLRRSNWSMPVILITAFGDDGLHSEATRLGATAVLDKPFDIQVLRELTKTVVMV